VTTIQKFKIWRPCWGRDDFYSSILISFGLGRTYYQRYTIMGALSGGTKQVGSESGMLLVMLGCNSGWGGENFSKVKRLVRKGVGTRKKLFSEFSWFLHQMCGIFEKQELFPKTYLTHKTTYAYLSCSWAGGISMKFRFRPILGQ